MNFCFLKRLFPLGFLAALVSCGENTSAPEYNPAIGPFDENGNYVEAWADNPPKSRRSRQAKITTSSNQKTSSSPASSNNRIMERPKLSATMEPPRPKPKVKPNPRKVRPPTIRHRVKTGDTLYGLSRKYGTTVSKIQKANQLRGTIIINGSVLVIPR